jgi:membrane-associated phospholipid phosphatase
MIKPVKTSFVASELSITRPYRLVLIFLFIASLCVDKGMDVLWINGHYTAWLDSFFKTITNLGDGLIFIPITLLALFIRFRYAIAAVAASVAHGLLISLFKRLLFPGLERPRKFLGDDLIHFVSGIDVHNANSFPSGHTATAFCAALFLALLSRNKVIGIFALLLATLVGYSRIYLAQHFLIDVAAGAVIGSFTTYIAWQIVEFNTLPAWMNRKLNIPSASTNHKSQPLRLKVKR